MDKIRDTEEIIEELENCFLGYDEYILSLLAELKESRDEEIKKLRDALGETIRYMQMGEIDARERGECFISILNQAVEALKDGE